MFRRVLVAIKEAFKPHWDSCEDPINLSIVASTVRSPVLGSILAAASKKSKDDDDEAKPS